MREMLIKSREKIRELLGRIAQNSLLRKALRHLGHAGLLPRAIWIRLPVEQTVDRTFTVQVPNGSSFLYASVLKDQIGRALFWRGLEGFEGETVPLFSRLARSDIRCFLDIGAHTGFYTLLACALNPGLQVIAFEPVPYIHKILAAHLKMNRLEGRVQARLEAVSNEIGQAKMHVPYDDLPTSASLHETGFRGNDGYFIDVPVTTIDTCCPSGQRVDLVKIDVEWFEDKVLEGMPRVLAESAPAIFVEITHDGPTQAVEAILKKFGYRFYCLRPEGPIPVKQIITDSQKSYLNYFCTVRSELPK
jgi:FkbM family methyltransferase